MTVFGILNEILKLMFKQNTPSIHKLSEVIMKNIPILTTQAVEYTVGPLLPAHFAKTSKNTRSVYPSLLIIMIYGYIQADRPFSP